MSEYHDLEQFDGEFVPQQNPNFQPGLDTIADGSYDWTILHASLDLTPRTQDRLLRLELKCEQTTQVVQHTYFLTGVDRVNMLGGDLATLGFEVGTWTAEHGKKFSQELPKAVAELPGIRFKGTKKANPGKNDPTKVYHNLYVNSRIPGRVEVPARSGRAGTTAAPAGANSIPF